jgi:hypothetical protein
VIRLASHLIRDRDAENAVCVDVKSNLRNNTKRGRDSRELKFTEKAVVTRGVRTLILVNILSLLPAYVEVSDF